MNLAFLHYSIPPVVGGVESVLAWHARLARAAGHAVVLLAARGDSLGPDLPLQRLPLADSRHPRVLAVKAELDAGRVPPDFARLRDELAQQLQAALAGQEVLLAHNVCSLHKNLALTAALWQLHGQPGSPRLVLWHHDLAWTAAHYAAELHPGYPWELLRQDWPGAQHVVVSAVRQAELARLIGAPPGQIRVVPNGVDEAALFKLAPQTVSLAAAMGLNAAAPLLLLPVRLTPRKNIELALHTLRALRKRGEAWSRAALLVTGPEGAHNPANAALRARLLALRDELGLRGAAHFAVEHTAENLPDEVVGDFFRLADALFLPSREEGFGIPLIEAALARLPVFCADIPTLRELGGSEVRYFAPDAAPEAVAELLAEGLQAHAPYRFAVRARQGYTWRGVYARHIAPLLRQVLEGGSG